MTQNQFNFRPAFILNTVGGGREEGLRARNISEIGYCEKKRDDLLRKICSGSIRTLGCVMTYLISRKN